MTELEKIQSTSPENSSLTIETSSAVSRKNSFKDIPLSKHDKRCVVIGATRLCVFVLEQLSANGWSVLYVVSEDEIVKRYCDDKKLELATNLGQADSRSFILFSVVNHTIISDSFLNDRDVVLAINYHDSLLPKYAGLNSTTWAIYNKEEIHGVSWHTISSKIDEGEILKQSSFKVSSNETAFSLNIKCFEEAAKLFVSILTDLESGSIEITEQDIAKKTYYGRGYVFENYGLIDFNDDFEKIDRIYRSLYFGEKDYVNPVASIKIWDGEKVYLVESLDFHAQVTALPGRVYSISESVLSIGIKGGKLSFRDLKTLEGKPISLHETNFQTDKAIGPCKINKSDCDTLSKIRNDELKLFRLLKTEKWKTTTFFRCESIINDYDEYHFSLPLNKVDSQTALRKVAFTLLKFINNDLCVPIIVSNPFCRFFPNLYLGKLSCLGNF